MDVVLWTALSTRAKRLPRCISRIRRVILQSNFDYSISTVTPDLHIPSEGVPRQQLHEYIITPTPLLALAFSTSRWVAREAREKLLPLRSTPHLSQRRIRVEGDRTVHGLFTAVTALKMHVIFYLSSFLGKHREMGQEGARSRGYILACSRGSPKGLQVLTLCRE